MLNYQQFKKLCNESTLNSIYLSDYKNSLNISPATVQTFFDSYIDSLMIDYIEKYPSSTNKQRDEHYQLILDNFNVDDAYIYYRNALSFDSLPRDDYDGVYSLSAYNGYLFYSFNEYYIESAYFYFNTDNHLVTKNYRLNKIKYDKHGDAYIIKNKIKLYLRTIYTNNNDAINIRS